MVIAHVMAQGQRAMAATLWWKKNTRRSLRKPLARVRRMPGKLLQKELSRMTWRSHYGSLLCSPSYYWNFTPYFLLREWVPHVMLLVWYRLATTGFSDLLLTRQKARVTVKWSVDKTNWPHATNSDIILLIKKCTLCICAYYKDRWCKLWMNT